MRLVTNLSRNRCFVCLRNLISSLSRFHRDHQGDYRHHQGLQFSDVCYYYSSLTRCRYRVYYRISTYHRAEVCVHLASKESNMEVDLRRLKIG